MNVRPAKTHTQDTERELLQQIKQLKSRLTTLEMINTDQDVTKLVAKLQDQVNYVPIFHPLDWTIDNNYMNDLFIVIIKFIPGSSDMECYERAKYLLETGVNKTLQQSFMQILLIYLDLKSRRLFP